jgi:GDP-L-fucose synthase
MNPEFYRGKKVLVTGASGLIGSNLLPRLSQAGAELFVTVHQKPVPMTGCGINLVTADLRKTEDCRKAVEKMDMVFHCAAVTSGAVMIRSNPVIHITDNLAINSQLLEASWRAGVKRFLFLSTSTIYPAVSHPVKEEEAFDGEPFEAYFGVGWMKRYIEKLCEFYFRQYGMQMVIVRPTNAYGPNDKFDFETSHVLPALIRRALENQNPFEVWGDGTAVRDFVYIDDLIEGLLLAMEKGGDCKAFNMGGGHPMTIRESVEAILKVTGRSHYEVRYDPSKPTTIPKRLIDISRSKQLLGWVPKTPFEEGLQKTVEWYQNEARRLQK